MHGPGEILRLVARARSRLWRREAVRLFRLGLYGAAALTGLMILFDRWLDSPFGRSTLEFWPLILTGAAPLVAVLIVAACRRPSNVVSAMAADRWAGAGQLLITAWELMQHEKPAVGTAPLVLRQAASALPDWVQRLQNKDIGQNRLSLLPPLLLWGAAISCDLLSNSGNQPPQDSSRADPTVPRRPTVASDLAAAIAELAATPEAERPTTGPALGGGGGADRFGASLSLSSDAGTLGPQAQPSIPSPSGTRANATMSHPVQDVNRLSLDTPLGGQGGGIGTQAPLPAALGAGADRLSALPQLSPGTFGSMAVTRTGILTPDHERPGQAFDTSDVGRFKYPSITTNPAQVRPATSPPRLDDEGLGAAERTLLSRYWTQLRIRTAP
jgi:hypothetical protein